MVSNAGQSLNLGSAYAEVILAAKIDRSLRDIDRTLGQSLQNVGDQVTNLGGALTKLTAPITAFGATGISTFARFDDTLTEISARTGTFGAELDLIREKALELGADTVFSSQQVLDAFLDLTSSGQTVAEAMVTLEDVTTLAAAGNLELGRAADLTTDLMSVFSLELEQSGEIADALARGAGSSSASVAQLGEALINGGPVAAQFGLSLDETTAILAVFAEAGIKGSEAGTQLRSMLLNMGRDTDTVNAAWKDLGTQLFDSEGNIRNLNDVVMDINSGLENLTEEEGTKALTALAGSYGIVGLRALLAADGITEMEARMLAQVDAATVAQQQMSSLGNRLGSLRGSIETLQITLFGLNQGPLTDFIDTLINAVNRVTQFARENPELAQTIFSVATAAAAAGPALIVLGQVITSIGVVAGVVFSPLGLVAGTILAIAGAIAYAYRQNLGGFADALHEIGKGVRLFVGRFRETGNVFDA
ncbi:MAG: phage tail tape measure protein, partial [Chloroflexota bacterium]